MQADSSFIRRLQAAGRAHREDCARRIAAIYGDQLPFQREDLQRATHSWLINTQFAQLPNTMNRPPQNTKPIQDQDEGPRSCVGTTGTQREEPLEHRYIRQDVVLTALREDHDAVGRIAENRACEIGNLRIALHELQKSVAERQESDTKEIELALHDLQVTAVGLRPVNVIFHLAERLRNAEKQLETIASFAQTCLECESFVANVFTPPRADIGEPVTLKSTLLALADCATGPDDKLAEITTNLALDALGAKVKTPDTSDFGLTAVDTQAPADGLAESNRKRLGLHSILRLIDNTGHPSVPLGTLGKPGLAYPECIGFEPLDGGEPILIGYDQYEIVESDMVELATFLSFVRTNYGSVDNPPAQLPPAHYQTWLRLGEPSLR